jgi:dihydrofolate reductase
MANHPPVSIIVAATENQVIGKAGGMPWHLPNDLRFFKEKTHGHVLLMGRKTWDSIGRALPGRTTVVLTQNRSWQADGTTVVHSLKEGLDAYAYLLRGGRSSSGRHLSWV